MEAGEVEGVARGGVANYRSCFVVVVGYKLLMPTTFTL